MTRLLTVGVTFFVSKTHDSIWSNGAVQNVIFLYLLLRQIPTIKDVVLINAGDAEAPLPGLMLDSLHLRFFSIDEVEKDLDVLIEAGAQISADVARRIRGRGGKVVAFRVGNDLVMDVERVLFGRPSCGIFNGTQFDATWTIPQHATTCSSYFEVMHRCPTLIVPHIWSPIFLEAAIKELPKGVEFGYRPGNRPKRISIFEPNINVLKTCFVPLLVAELAFRKDPSLISEVYLTNSLHIKDHVTFQHFIGNLDLAREKIVSAEARFPIPFFLAKYTDVVLSHQWENGLNYMYYDCLYGGYPLVHNSSMLGCGYMYSDFDAKHGSMVLEEVLLHHDLNHEKYVVEANEFLKTVSLNEDRNLHAYEEALQNLF